MILCLILPIMIDLSHTSNQIHYVTNFKDLVSTPFRGEINAICWTRKLIGDFSEIANKIELNENIAVLDQDELIKLKMELIQKNPILGKKTSFGSNPCATGWTSYKMQKS